MDLVVMIGMDPHKRSVTIEARDAREVLRATGTFPASTAGYKAMVAIARQWPRRVWAVEGAQGVGRPIAQRLLAGGEQVLDVPAKLAARARVFDTGPSTSGAVKLTRPTRTPSRWPRCGTGACARCGSTRTWRCCGCLLPWAG